MVFVNNDNSLEKNDNNKGKRKASQEDITRRLTEDREDANIRANNTFRPNDSENAQFSEAEMAEAIRQSREDQNQGERRWGEPSRLGQSSRQVEFTATVPDNLNSPNEGQSNSLSDHPHPQPQSQPQPQSALSKSK